MTCFTSNTPSRQELDPRCQRLKRFNNQVLCLQKREIGLIVIGNSHNGNRSEHHRSSSREFAVPKDPMAPSMIYFIYLNLSLLSEKFSQEELGIPYEIKKYKRVNTYFAPPELKKIHPLGKSPIITDGDVTVAESGAIVGMCHRD